MPQARSKDRRADHRRRPGRAVPGLPARPARNFLRTSSTPCPTRAASASQLYGDKPIYDIPGTPQTTGRALVESLLQQVAPLKPRFHFGEQVDSLAPQPDGRWLLGTTGGKQFLCRTVFIAAGVGAFVPKRIAVDGIERFEGTQLFYHPESLDRFAGQTVVVNGGDDAALETALALAGVASQVTLLHRRDAFQAEDATVAPCCARRRRRRS